MLRNREDSCAAIEIPASGSEFRLSVDRCRSPLIGVELGANLQLQITR